METTKNPALCVPPEIWTTIFGKVNIKWLEDTDDLSINDLLTCSQVCVTFQNVLKPTRSTWMFQEILPLIAQYINNASTTKIRSPLLRCRKVCKAWKRGVDHYVETHDLYNQANMEKGRTRRRQIYSIAPLNLTGNVFTTPLPMCKLYTSERIALFINQMEEHEDNPFPGKSLRLPHWPINDDPLRHQDEQFWNVDVILLLTNFGKFITVLHLDLCLFSAEFGISPETFCGRVSRSLAHTPNLRRLCIHGYLNEPLFEKSVTLDNWVGFYNPLPHLDTVEFDDAGRHQYAIPFPLQCTIFSSYVSQLKRLKLPIMESNLYKINDSRVLAGCLPNLEELDVTIDYTPQLCDLSHLVSKSTKLSCLKIFISSVTFRKNLNSANQTTYQSGELSEVNLGVVLKLTHKLFRNSLRILIIAADMTVRKHCTARQKDFEILKDFPLLKFTHIEGFPLYKLQILHCLPRNLEFLSLDGEWVWDYDWNSGNIIISADVPDGKNTFYARLWETLPRLRWLSVTASNNGKLPIISMYHREKWEWLVRTGQNQLRTSDPSKNRREKESTDFCCSVV